MKLKGISVFEQHADKAVLGLMGVVFLGVVAQQMLTQPNTVKVGTAALPPAQAFDPVEAAAKTIEGQLNSAAGDMPQVKGFSLADKVSIGAQAAHELVRPLALGESVSLGAISAARQVASGTYDLPTVPVATNVVARASVGTINPLEVVRNAELAKLVPAQQPFDKASVSIEGSFSGATLRATLEADPDGSGPKEPLPLAWWRDLGGRGEGVQIVAVEVERQTIRLADGSTPKSPIVTTVQSMPGRPNFRTEWDKVKNLGDVPQYLDVIRSNAEQIQRPAFYTTIAGPEWTPPAEAPAVLDADGASQKQRLQSQLEQLDQQIQDLEQKLNAAGGPRLKEPPPPNETAAQRKERLEREKKDREREEEEKRRQAQIGGGGGGGGRRGAAPRTDVPPSGEGARPDKPTLSPALLEGQIRSKRAQREKVAKKLEAMGEKVAPIAGTPGAATIAAAPGFFDDPDIRVWAHDLTAEPGAAYRYRLRVIINNPLFGRNLQDSQKPLSQNSTIAGPWSDWTGDVPVDQFDYFFVTSADSQSAVTGRPRASIELYQFYYGYYRVARVSAEPGDWLAGDASLPELKLADMDKLRAFSTDAAADPATTSVPPGGVPGGPGGTGPGAGPRRMPAPGRPDDRTPPPSATTGAPGGAPAGPDWLSVVLPRTRRLQVSATLLNVAPVPFAPLPGLLGGSGERFAVVLRNQTGALSLRSPDDDRSQDVYKRVLASEKLGETQGAPVIKPVEEPRKPTGPKRPQEPAGRGPGGG